MNLYEDTLDQLNRATLKSQIADYIAKDAVANKKVQDAIAKAQRAKIKDEEDLAKAHPVIDAIASGVKTGGAIFSTLAILSILVEFMAGRAGAGFARAMIGRIAKTALKDTVLIAGIKIPVNYILKWLDKKEKNMNNESLGNRILEKLNRCLGEDVEQVDPTEAETEGDANLGSEMEKSETLRKLENHLSRFQEAEGDKKIVAAGALGGAVGGRQLARYAAGHNSGAREAIKATKNASKEAVKNQGYFGAKALNQQAKSKVAKITGDAAKARTLSHSAQASANAAGKAEKTVKAANKVVGKLQKTMNAAGRAGALKGAAIGAGAAFLGKKAYDKFKK